MRVLIKEKLSPNKYKTPEGYLVCVDAILARTGKQQYRRNELYVDSDDDSIVDVDRPYDEVFSEQTIASFENKPFVNEHPNEDVNVHNHKDYAVGFVRDVHKGEVDGEPVLLGNLIITDEETIAEIESGEKTELSCGYDCDITDDENPCQRNIRGNHVALCKAGRAGIARIQDSQVEDSSEDDFYDELFSSNLKYEFIKGGYGIKFKTPRDYQKAKEIAKRTHYSKGKWYDKDLEFFEYGGITISNEDSIADSKWYAVYGEESGYMKEFKTLSEAKKFIKEVKSFDKREGIEDEYYIEVEVHDSIKDAGTTRRMFRESEVGDENSWFGTTEWGTPKGSMYIYKKNGKIIAEGTGSGYWDELKNGEKKEFNSVKDLNKWLNTPVNDSIKDVRTLSISGWGYKDNDFTKELNEVKQLYDSNNIDDAQDKLNNLLNVAEYCLHQIDNATSRLNGERKDYYENIISQLMDLRKQHNLKDGECDMKDKLENKPVKVRIKFESNQEANDALKMLCKKEQFIDCDLIFDDTVEVKTTDVYVDDLKKALRLYFVKKIEVKDSIKDDNYDNLEAYLKTVGADDRAYSIYKEASRTSLFGFKKFAQVNGGVYKKIDVEKAWNIVNGKVKDSEELVEDGRLIEPEQQYVKEFERMIQRAGFKIDRTGKTISGRLHYQVITNQKGYDEKELMRFERELEKISNTMKSFGIPMTYDVGLQYDTYISAGIDLDKQYVKDSVEDTNCQDEAIYMYIADPDDDKDIIYEAKHYGLKLEKFGGLIKVIGTLTQIAKTLKMLPEDVIAYSKKSMSTIKKVRDKSVEDSIKDSYIAYDIFSKSYAMESDRAELTTIEKYAKKFNSESEAIRYMNKYFKIPRKDIIVKKVNDSIKDSKVNSMKYIDIIKKVKEVKDSKVKDSLDKTYKPGQKVKISNGFNLEREMVIVKKDTGSYILTEDGRKINKASVVDSKVEDSVYKIKTFNNKWYYEETREDGYSNLVGPFKTSAEARAALQKHRPNVKVRHLESGTYYDAMELSAKTSEELDNLMKQYQKKHPTWKFGEIKKDKGLYKCSVVKDSKVKDSDKVVFEIDESTLKENNYMSDKKTLKIQNGHNYVYLDKKGKYWYKEVAFNESVNTVQNRIIRALRANNIDYKVIKP